MLSAVRINRRHEQKTKDGRRNNYAEFSTRRLIGYSFAGMPGTNGRLKSEFF